MAVNIRDPHLEERLERQREARGHSTLTKTARELLIERLIEIERAEARPSERRRAKAS